MTNPVSTVLFDLDGTLIDSIDLILTSYRHTLIVHRGETPADDVWLAGLGTPLRSQFRAFTDDKVEIDAMIATYREHNLANHDAMVREYPGARDAVARLKARGCRLGIVTSKMRAGAFRGLERCGYDGLFEVVVGADDVNQPKPNAEPVLKALELLEGEAGSTVFVGDSPHDLVAGRGAGVRTAAALWGPFTRATLAPHAPDYWLMEPVEIDRIAP
jgi:pyrophosphatase PpaX